MQLNITNVGPSDFGAYHCIAKNEMGITKGIFTMFGKSFFDSIFAKLQKSSIRFVISVCLSVCLSVSMEKIGSYWMYFMKFEV
jgi:hypothetical protein